MKTRSSNLMIGSVTLAVLAAAFVAHVAFQKLRNVQQRSPLRITFEGSASGLRKGGAVNFDGVEVGKILSLKLDNPRKVVALAMVDNSAPIREDTVVGLEFQGLTGVAAISLVGGAATAGPAPLDKDGIRALAADLSETESIRDSLHHVDRMLVDNRAALKDSLLSFEIYTASLVSKGEAIDGIIRKTDGAFEMFNNAISGIDDILPGLAHNKAEELFEKVRSLRELADNFKKHSAVVMEEGRRSLLEISEGAIKITRKFDSQPAREEIARPPRRPPPKRQ